MSSWLSSFSRAVSSGQSSEATGPLLFLLACGAMMGYTSSCRRVSNYALSPPIAKQIKETVYFGVNPKKNDEFRGNNAMSPPKTRTDPYFWMRDDTRKSTAVLNHIKKENDYCEAQMAKLKPLQDELYAEMLTHFVETDEDVPYTHGDYLYYSRTVKGSSYPIHCRKLKGEGMEEEVLLDENELAQGHEQNDVHARIVSPDHRYYAFSVDHTGYETYAIRIKDLSTGKLLPDAIEDTNGEIEWGKDSSVLFYMKVDTEHRPFELYMHEVGKAQQEDVKLLREDDALFWMGMSKSASERFLFLEIGSKETSEWYMIDLKHATGAQGHREAAFLMSVIARREFGLRYEVEHHDDLLLIVTNKDGAVSQKLVAIHVTESNGSSSLWHDVRPYDAAIQIDHVMPFKAFIAIFGRQGGLERVWLADAHKLSSWIAISMPEVCYSVGSGDNYEYASDRLRLVYSSLLSPSTVFDYQVKLGEQIIVKVKEVPFYDKSKYASFRIEATVRDGTKVPMSIVCKKSLLADPAGTEFKLASPQPLFLYGYGSYGACIDPTFDFKRLSLLDRDVVYAIAHIRGGGEMGRHWYEDKLMGGKYKCKINTFNDFADCAQHLINTGVTSSDRIGMVGRSAGGLLIGAVLNMYPSLFKCAVADVPFVDVMTTVCDPTIPLTVVEWEEWGNPNLEEYYAYMLSYSPVDNVKAQHYPSLLVTAGLFDPRVAYWEPLKWVQKLRVTKTDSNPLLLKTDMAAGHFSASDRYKYIRESAFEMSFVLNEIAPSSCAPAVETSSTLPPTSA